MRIAMVSEHASPLAAITGEDAGGQNVHVAELATGLARIGHEVIVYTRRAQATIPDRVPFGEGVWVEHLRAGPAGPLSKDSLPPHMPEFGRELKKAWQRDRPDVVHAHFWMSGMAAIPVAADLGVPVVQTFHALGSTKRHFQGEADTSPPERDRVERFVARSSALVVATSQEEKEQLLTWGVRPERVTVVPCGVDMDRFTPEGPQAPGGERPRVLSLGRLVPRKGVDTIIRAMPDVPEAELLIAGGPYPHELETDPEISRLRTIADEAGLTDRVRFLGCVDRADVPALIRSVDVAVNVPWYEPFGISTVESMACGIPVIASRVGGHKDTVVHGETGLLVPSHQPGRLAQTLSWLLAEPAVRTLFSTAARERAEELYSWTEVVRATEECYRSVTSVTVPTPRTFHDRPSARAVGTVGRGSEE